MSHKPSLSVLLIEDNPVDVLLLQGALDADLLSEFSLTHVERLEEGLRRLKQERFDIALVDLGLPDSSGLETFKKLHAQSPDLPVVVFSGNEDEEQAIQAVRAGAQEYLVKGMSGFEMAPRAIRYAVERKRVEEKLRDSEERHRLITGLMSDYVYSGFATPDGRAETEWISGAVEQITGYSFDEIRALPGGFASLVFPEDLQKIIEIQPRLFNGETLEVEYRIRCRNGETRWLLDFIKPVGYDASGTMLRLLGAVQDITEHKQAESELKESEERFSTAFFTNPVAQSILSLTTGQVLEVNNATCHLFEYSREELIGVEPKALNLWANPAEQLAALDELQRTGHLLPREVTIRRKSGRLSTALFAAEPITWKGTPCLITSSVDITERKQVENALRESEQRFAALFRSNPVPIGFTRESDYSIVDVNDAWTSLTGYTREEAIGKTSTGLGLAKPETLNSLRGMLGEQGKVNQLEIPLRTRSGQDRSVLLSSEPVELGGETYFLNNLLDITERKHKDAVIQRNEHVLRLFVEHSPAAIAMFDTNMRYIVASRRYLQDYGLGEQDLSGRSHYEVFPEISEKWKEIHRRCLNGAIEKADEDPFPRADGTLDWVRWEIRPWYETEGNIGGIILFSEVITERKRNEMLIYAQRDLAGAIGRFHTTEEGFRAFLESILNLTGLDSGGIYLFDPEFHSLDLIQYQGLSDTFIQQATHFAPDSPNVKMILPGSPHYFSSDDPVVQNPMHKLEGLKALAVIPLLYQERVVGCLNLASHTLSEVSVHARHVLETLSTEIGNFAMYIRSQEALRESESKYRTLITSTTDGVFVAQDEKFIFANPALPASLGYESDEFANIPFEKVLAPEYLKVFVERFRKRIAGKTPISNYQIQFMNKACTEKIWFELRANLTTYQGRPAVLGIARDITERKRAEEKLRASEERLRLTLQTTSDGFWIVGTDRRFLEVNEAYCSMSGYSREEFLQLTISDIEVIESVEDTQDRIRKITETGADRFETRHRRKDGSILDVEVSVNLLDQEEGLMICFCRDITERKRSEILLGKRMEDLALINKLNDAVNRGGSLATITDLLATETKKTFGSLSASIYLLDRDKRHLVLEHYTMPAEKVERLEKLLGRFIPQISIPVDGDDHFNRALTSEKGFLITGFEDVNAWLADFTNTTFLTKKVRLLLRKIIPSATRLLNINSVISLPLKIGDDVVGLFEFVTEDFFDESTLERLQNIRQQLSEVIVRKRAEQSLRESEEKYRLLSEKLEERVKQRTAEVQDLYDNAPNGYHSLDEKGCFIQVNQTELNWLGYTREELLGRLYTDFITPQSQATFRENFPAFKQRGWVRDLEFELVRKDGSTFPVLVSATLIKDADGNYLMSRSTVFDNSVRKKAEDALRASEAQLRQSRDELSIANLALEKAARMKDEFLASMSHELRTPLTGILGLSEALQLKTYGELNERQQKTLKNIEESGRHLLELINDILDLSKIEAGKLDLNFAPCSVADVCQASLQLTKGMAHQKNQIVRYSAPTAHILVQADARRFKQILVNLLSNAVKFTPKDGEIGLEVRVDDAGQSVDLTVWDKGIGIKEEDLGRLFQPFTQIDSSLAREYSGTGLGLSLVRRLVELHNGSVKGESVLGTGSRFTVTLPCALPVTTPEPRMPRFENGEDDGVSKHARSSTLPRVFVVDDAEVTLEMLEDYLTAKRYRVTTARSGFELLRRVADVRPGVIVLDIQMPGMDGMEVIRKLRAHADPAVAATPIIAVTALAMSGDRERCLEAGANEYMSKPVRLGELTKAIENLLPSSREANHGQK